MTVNHHFHGMTFRWTNDCVEDVSVNHVIMSTPYIQVLHIWEVRSCQAYASLSAVTVLYTHYCISYLIFMHLLIIIMHSVESSKVTLLHMYLVHE